VPVVDASVVVDLVAPDVGGDAPARVLFGMWATAGTEVAAPSLLWLETSNALLTGIRRGRWSGADADAAQVRLERIPLRRADGARDVARAFELARRYDNWPVYDMVYVALAERLGTELITADQRLRARLAHLAWVRGIDEAAG
jgi:predicted nucleic acid-binding protein